MWQLRISFSRGISLESRHESSSAIVVFQRFLVVPWDRRAQWRSNDGLSRPGTVKFISRSRREQDPRSEHNGGQYYDRDGEYHLQVANEIGRGRERNFLPSYAARKKRNDPVRGERPFAQPYHVRNPSTGLISRVWLCSYLLYCEPSRCADGLSPEWRKSEFLRCSWNTIMWEWSKPIFESPK